MRQEVEETGCCKRARDRPSRARLRLHVGLLDPVVRVFADTVQLVNRTLNGLRGGEGGAGPLVTRRPLLSRIMRLQTSALTSTTRSLDPTKRVVREHPPHRSRKRFLPPPRHPLLEAELACAITRFHCAICTNHDPLSRPRRFFRRTPSLNFRLLSPVCSAVVATSSRPADVQLPVQQSLACLAGLEGRCGVASRRLRKGFVGRRCRVRGGCSNGGKTRKAGGAHRGAEGAGQESRREEAAGRVSRRGLIRRR